MSKIINRDLNLKLIKKRTLQSIFKILINETVIKSKELDLHNRFIFDYFYKNNIYNSKITSIGLKDRFYSLNLFRYSRFIYFFFNANLFINLQSENNNTSKFIHTYLFNRKKFISIFFNKANLFNYKNLSLWAFNISLNNILSFLDDVSFLENQIKDYLHEEGKNLFIRKVLFSKIFFVRFFQRKYHVNFFKDVLYFYKNITLVNKKFGFNILYFYISFFFLSYVYLFISYFIFSIFFIFDLFFQMNNRKKNG